MEWFLKIHDDLRAVCKGQSDHATHSLVVDIGIRLIIDPVTSEFDGRQQRFGKAHEFRVGHYNLRMFNRTRILVSTLSPLCLCVLLTACGQTGALYLPKRPVPLAGVKAPPSAPAATASPNTSTP